MTIDPGLQAYIEESRELLEQTEDTLLQLEENSQDGELVNQLFRAVHTIKGSSGLFGFDAVVEFTHVTESVMGRIRDGELELNDDLLTLFLKCRDHIAQLVDHALADEGELEDEVRQTGKALITGLEGYLSAAGETEAPAATEPEHGDSAAPGADDAPVEGQVESDNWHISLRFGREVLRNGMDPLSFLRYLVTVGDIVSLTTLYDDLPEPAKMDPECCYLGFEIDLKSEADKEAIEGVFEFVQDDCVIHILPPHSHLSRFIQLIDELPEEKLRVGEILALSGALTRRELDEALREQDAEAGDGESEQPVSPIGEVVVKQGVVAAPVVEAALGKQKKVEAAKALDQQAVRVNAGKLEALINLVGELVISGAHSRLMAERAGDTGLLEATENMSWLVEEIRDTALELRMVQIGETFNRFRRVVRELSRDIGKEIELRISGGDTELDKTVVEKIGDPLMHLVRNSIDHGIEMPGLREESGKPKRASVELNAYHDSGSIVIEVVDDGAGLPRDKILAKALERGLVKPNQPLTDHEIFRLIFEPGFSTAEKVTNISGRGVGMDVVRRNIEALRGLVDVESTPGVGSKFTIRLPLTLAIIDGFQVRVGEYSYVIPLDQVDECFELTGENANGDYRGDYVNMRGEVLPYVRLNEVFSVAGDGDDKTHRDNIVVVQFGDQRAGLVVDELLGEYQTVIKPLGKVFQHLKGFNGATILGSGEVAMIVDVPALIQQVTAKAANAAGGFGRGEPQRTH